jgi:beta-aspartyl-peptidase (threonine type)
MNPALAIHGGAGLLNPNDYTEKNLNEYFKTLKESLVKGHEVLEKGGNAMDAVISSIKVLEDSPLFNAGRGGVFAENGIVELDASIMDGKSLNAGAVTCVHKIKNPILAANEVLNFSPHVMLSGNGAELFAFKRNLELVENNYFQTNHRLSQLENAKKKNKISIDHSFGTVGAVAIDQNGDLAAGTSTGGLTNKYYGRVSDTSIIGAGNYANNRTCAISGTGTGDPFIKTVLAYDFSCLIEYKNCSMETAGTIVLNKLKSVGGHGGIIAIDKNGNIHMDFNSTGMFRGYIKDKKIFYGAFEKLNKGDLL